MEHKPGNHESESSEQTSRPSGYREEEQNRRGLFAPIVLILLVLSLIGNVYLYALQLQGNKDDRTEQGMTIIHNLNETKSSLQGIGAGLEAVVNAQSLEERMLQKQELVKLMMFASIRLPSVLDAADGRGGSEPLAEQTATSAIAFLSDAGQSVAAIGNDADTLTSEEKDYLIMLQQSFINLEATLEPVQFDNAPTKMMALQTAGGGAWVDAVYALAEAMQKAELKPYSSRGQ